jgi:hypothetical protein
MFVLSGDDAKRFNDWINAQPPVTDVETDTFLFVENKAAGAILVDFVKDGCVFNSGIYETKAIDHAIDQVFGAGA